MSDMDDMDDMNGRNGEETYDEGDFDTGLLEEELRAAGRWLVPGC